MHCRTSVPVVSGLAIIMVWLIAIIVVWGVAVVVSWGVIIILCGSAVVSMRRSIGVVVRCGIAVLRCVVQFLVQAGRTLAAGIGLGLLHLLPRARPGKATPPRCWYRPSLSSAETQCCQAPSARETIEELLTAGGRRLAGPARLS